MRRAAHGSVLSVLGVSAGLAAGVLAGCAGGTGGSASGSEGAVTTDRDAALEAGRQGRFLTEEEMRELEEADRVAERESRERMEAQARQRERASREASRRGTDASRDLTTPIEVTEIAGLKIDHDAWARLGYRWDWAAQAEFNRRATVEHVLATDDFVAVQDTTTRVTILEPTTGRTRWAADTATPLTKATSLDRVGSKLLVSTRPELFVLDLGSGNLLTRQPMAVVVSTAPAIAGGLAIYGTPPGELLAHAFGDRDGNIRPAPMDRGRKDWGYDLRGGIEGDPVLIGDSVAVVTQAGDIGFFDYRSGSAVARSSIAGGLAGDPVTDGEVLFVASLDQSVYAISPEDGTHLWRHRTAAPIRSQPRVIGASLVVALPGDGLTAFDAESGEVLWSNADVGGDVIAVRRGELLVFDGETAWMVDPARGDVIERASLGGFSRVVTDGFVDGNLYAVGPKGGVAKFRPR